MNKSRILDALTVLVLLFAVAIAFRPRSALSNELRTWRTQLSQDRKVRSTWRELSSVAIPLYAGDAAPDVIEVIDYECPFCRRISPVIDSAVAAGARVAVVHLPLQIHPKAEGAALAATCAATINAFRPVHAYLVATEAWRTDSVSAPADSLLRSLVPDVARCLREAADRLAQHRRLVDALALTGTPTFLTSGGVMREPPTYEAFLGVRR